MRHLALGLATLSLAFFAVPACAQNLLALEVGEAELIRLPAPADAVFVADPGVADVQVAAPQTIIVFGVGTGVTRLFALDADGATLATRQVRVEHNLSDLRQLIERRFPGNAVRLSSGPRSIMLEGVARTPDDALAIRALVAGLLVDGESLIDRMTVDMPTQVNLRVRIAEVSRSVDRTFGIDLSALFGIDDVRFAISSTLGRIGTSIDGPDSAIGFDDNTYSIDGVIDALDEQGLARTLAEPNLTAVSGETATFLAGGEFPIPVAQDEDTITIEFRSFGVSLAFTPTVLGADRINLLVRPEVSDLSDNGAIVTDGGIRIPALTVRRVETSVELGSGQSLAIGGLLQQSTRDLVAKFPGLGDVPILGTLFTSTEFRNDETELIVLVTPYIVRPTRPDAFDTPLGQPAPTAALEALLLNRLAPALEPEEADRGRLNGRAGFIY